MFPSFYLVELFDEKILLKNRENRQRITETTIIIILRFEDDLESFLGSSFWLSYN